MSNRAERRAAARAPGSGGGAPAARRPGRVALLPAVVGAAAILAGLGLTTAGAYIVIRFLVAILAAVVAVFAVQSRAWWWLPFLGAVVVIWNPVVPVDLTDAVWIAVQVVAAAVLITAGATIRRPAGV